MSDFYTYRKEVAGRRRNRRVLLFVMLIVVLVCMAAGWFWFSQAEPVSAEVEPTAQPTAEPTPEPTPVPVMAAPARILPEVDTAAWDTAAPVAPTIDLEYLNTDARMVAVPRQGRVASSYFNTVCFAGDSIASGLGIYDTGYPNAMYCAYVSASANSFVNNAQMKNAVTGAQETPMEAIAALQPDYVYILVGTNNLVTAGNEEGFLAYYEKLIDMLRERLNPGVIYYIQAIPGVRPEVVQSKPGLDNARIETVNNMLANMALRKGCYFVNPREVLCTPDGVLREEIAYSDGIHMTPAGYGDWASYLAEHTVWNRRSIYNGENPGLIFGS